MADYSSQAVGQPLALGRLFCVALLTVSDPANLSQFRVYNFKVVLILLVWGFARFLHHRKPLVEGGVIV